MKSLLWLWASLAITLSTSAQDYLNCHFVPGWEQSGTRRQYSPQNLYDYRDGAAEGYLSFGFVRMQGTDCQSGSSILSIDVSEMSDADAAWGMFAANRDPGKPETRTGMAGQLLPQSFLFAKGKYFVEIIETDGSTSADQTAALAAFAARIEPLLEGRTTPPEALAWFPADAQATVRMVPQSVLGLRLLKQGYVATYSQGEAFLIVESSPGAAAAVMNRLREHFSQGQPASVADEALTVNDPYLKGVCIFRKGRYLGGYAKLPEVQTARAKAAEFSRRIP